MSSTPSHPTSNTDCNVPDVNNRALATAPPMPSTNHENHNQNSHTSTNIYPSPKDFNSPSQSTSDSATIRYICHHEDCGRIFQRKTALTNHLKAHLNVKSRSIKRTRRLRERERQQAAAEAIRAHAVVDRHAGVNRTRMFHSNLNENRGRSQGMTNTDLGAVHFPNDVRQGAGFPALSQMHGVPGLTQNFVQSNGMNVNKPDFLALSVKKIRIAAGNSSANQISAGDENDQLANFNSNQQPQLYTQQSQLDTNQELMIQQQQLLKKQQRQQHQLQEHFAYQAHIQRRQQLNQEALLCLSAPRQHQGGIPANMKRTGPETECVHLDNAQATPCTDDASSLPASSNTYMARHRPGPGPEHGPIPGMYPESQPQEKQQQIYQMMSYAEGENVVVNSSYMQEAYRSSSPASTKLKLQTPVHLRGFSNGLSQAHSHAPLLQEQVQGHGLIQTANQIQSHISTKSQQLVQQTHSHTPAQAQWKLQMEIPGNVGQVCTPQPNSNMTYPVTYIISPNRIPHAAVSPTPNLKNTQEQGTTVSEQMPMSASVAQVEVPLVSSFAVHPEPKLELEPEDPRPKGGQEVSRGNADQEKPVAKAGTKHAPMIIQTEVTEELGLADNVSPTEEMNQVAVGCMATAAEPVMVVDTPPATASGNIVTDCGGSNELQLNKFHYLRVAGSGSWSIDDNGVSRFMSDDSTNGTDRVLSIPLPIPLSMQAAISGEGMATRPEPDPGLVFLDSGVHEEEGRDRV